ncbi:MAG: DNA polymerase II [Ignavibacterium album]|jgi:DNA polymerase-2|uniref:DNA polymerase II n=1 Tax=Ignavibacterium album TaxID=591197 RepID=UPI0026EE0778|nr:DNA polymerase II [Ignavibacterium album]MCX8104444.1 DNA polymerase II [Ignavibacterium album]
MPKTTAKIFLLTGDWFDYKGKNIIRLIGTSDELGTAEVIVTNNKPVFFIERNTILNPLTKNFLRKETKLKNFNKVDVDALYFNTQQALQKYDSELSEQNIKTFESDVDPLRRYLMEKFIFAQIEVEGEAQKKNNITRFSNPQIKPANVNPDFVVASLDIETGINQLYSIAVHITGRKDEIKKVFMLGEPAKKSPDYISYHISERELLNNFIKWFNEIDPDIIIGWHVIGFDLLFLENKCNELNIPFNIARSNGKVIIRARKPSGFFASITGRIIIDGPTSLRASFFNFEDFKLETVAQELLGTGKTINPEKKKVDEIDRLFSEDKISLAEYNLNDAILVTDIFKKTGLLELSVRRSQISGLFIDQLGMMTNAFDHFYLPLLHRKGFVAPNLRDIKTQEHAEGGYVIEPEPGIYDNIVVLDFKSLYPSIIRTFKIDPYSLLMNDKDTITTLNGYKFSATHHILPDYIDELMKQRKEAVEKGDKQLSQAIKILMNSFYGVMGSYGCRFYHPDLPRAITGTGHKLLLGSKDYLERKGYKVVYGDTDSLFIKLKEVKSANGVIQGKKIAVELNNYWSGKLKSEHKIQSYLELEFEKFYEKFIITPARGSEAGAKKRYAGLVEINGKKEIEFVGMEFVRSDWTKLAKEFQEELYLKVFAGEEVDDFIRNTIKELKQGKYDDKLVYRKRLRKEVEDYTKNIPPHVRAAKMLREPGDVVYYVITERGPIPIQMKYNDIDYDHYIDKQLKPIADSVLALLGKSFDSIVGSDQMSFF